MLQHPLVDCPGGTGRLGTGARGSCWPSSSVEFAKFVQEKYWNFSFLIPMHEHPGFEGPAPEEASW